VFFDARSRRWLARVKHNRRTYSAGSWPTLAQADAAARAMRADLYGQ
jgi:hypothetical protein